MNTRTLTHLTTAVAFMALMAVPAFAQDASDVGSDFFGSLQTMITGNVGFFFGLLITVLGIYTWVVAQKTGAGIIMIIGGVLITLSPSLFNSARNLVGKTLQTVGGEQNLVTPESGI